VHALHILDLGTNGSPWSASSFCHFTIGDRAPATHWIVNWVDPRDSSYPAAKKKLEISVSARN
jgi:hypothetical protein